MSETKKYVFLSIAVVVLVAVAVAFFSNRNGDDSSTDSAVAGDSMDTASDFYAAWSSARTEGTTDAFVASLATNPQVSQSVRSYIENSLQDTERTLDPLLCHDTIPERFGFKISYEQERTAQYLVLARGLEEASPNVAVVDLKIVDSAWQITNIACSRGEAAPEREFSFEREGFLLKSVPPPLNPDNWHLVFEENGIMGHTAPLFFGAESTCVYRGGEEGVCDTSRFSDATQVTVRGEMTEAGVNVRRVNF